MNTGTKNVLRRKSEIGEQNEYRRRKRKRKKEKLPEEMKKSMWKIEFDNLESPKLWIKMNKK